MVRSKKPRKRSPEPETPEATELAPPPPAALDPAAPRPTDVAERVGPVVRRLVETVRAAIGAVLDVADAAAEAITKRLERRAP